ncbi:MAG: DNA-binding domain-containing protein [Bryobacteraceae bacterium]
MTLLELQRRMAHDIFQPLGASDRIAVAEDAVEYIKPNGWSPSKRLEIYSRSYWFRLLDSLYDDFPGLAAILGTRAFMRMAKAYLAECPSRSYTLRDLGSRLEIWLSSNPSYAKDRLDLALDMARLEWAHIEAFDGREDPVLGPEDLLELGPELRIALQPYVQLIGLQYPVDDLRIHVNRSSEEHAVASNAVHAKKRRAVRKISRLNPEKIFLAVHRVNFDVYYRRLAPEEFAALAAFRSGEPIGAAIAGVVENSELPIEQLQQMTETWFATWAELGWLCRLREDRE